MASAAAVPIGSAAPAARGSTRSNRSPIASLAAALLALGYARLGRIDEAMTALNEVLTRVQRTGEKCNLAEILRLKGEVTLMGDGSATAQAERCFRQSLEVARAQAARWWNCARPPVSHDCCATPIVATKRA